MNNELIQKIEDALLSNNKTLLVLANNETDLSLAEMQCKLNIVRLDNIKLLMGIELGIDNINV